MSDLNGQSRSSRLDAVLHALLTATPELEAAAVVSHDGLPMASALPAGMDEDRVAAMSAALLSLGERAAQGLGRGELSQVYVEGEDGTVFLVSAEDSAVLVAVVARGAKTGMMLYEVKRSAADVAAVLRPAPAVGPHAAPTDQGGYAPATAPYGTASYSVAGYEAPSAPHGAPAYSTPTYDAPAYSTPTYEAPAYSAPTYEAPTYSAPTYGGTTHEAPAYGGTHSAPTYDTPTYSTPTYDTPAYDTPTYEAPAAPPAPSVPTSSVPTPSAPAASETLWPSTAPTASGLPGDPQAWA